MCVGVRTRKTERASTQQENQLKGERHGLPCYAAVLVHFTNKPQFQFITAREPKSQSVLSDRMRKKENCC